MSTKKAKGRKAPGGRGGGRAPGGRVTVSPWAAARTTAHEIYDRLQAAGWVDAGDDDVPAMESGDLPLTKVCTCSPEAADELIARYATEPPTEDQAVAITLHDGPPVAVLVWPAG